MHKGDEKLTDQRIKESRSILNLTRELDLIKKQLNSQKIRLDNIQAERDRALVYLTTCQEQNWTLEAERTRLIDQLEVLQQHISNLELKIDAIKINTIDLENRNELLNQELNQIRALNLFAKKKLERQQKPNDLEKFDVKSYFFKRNSLAYKSLALHIVNEVQNFLTSNKNQDALPSLNNDLVMNQIDCSSSHDKKSVYALLLEYNTAEREKYGRDILLIEKSGIFDQEGYAGCDEAAKLGMSAIEHYIRLGEAAGLAPSSKFDPVYYADHNHDVTASGELLLLHYLNYGRDEGRASQQVLNSKISADPKNEWSDQIELIYQSGLFDAEVYEGQNDAIALGMSAAEHYLRIGEASGMFPSAMFDPAYYASQNLDVAASGNSLLLHYINYGRGEGRASRQVPNYKLLANPENEWSNAVDLIENSGFFNSTDYEGREDAHMRKISVIEHYIRFGEAAGIKPSVKFDPQYYSRRYKDIGKSSTGRLLHYIQCGRNEGRQPLPRSNYIEFKQIKLDQNRESILLLIHDASRTGAPILAWNLALEFSAKYNVVVLLKNGGELISYFDGPSIHSIHCFDEKYIMDEIELDYIIEAIVKNFVFKFAIANSVETRDFVPALERNGVPVIALVHEFSSYTKPLGVLWKYYSISSQIIFSSEITLEASVRDYPPLKNRSYGTIPQGSCKIPSKNFDTSNNLVAGNLLSEVLNGEENAFVIVGMGAVQIRKGVDLFVATAAEIKRNYPKENIRFIWIGSGYNPDIDQQYSVYLQEQILRSGLSENIFIGPVDNLDDYYSIADVFFLSSRLDPLPNVAIDAMLKKIPIVAFENASGIADLLMGDKLTAGFVAPYSSDNYAANLIMKLYFSPDLRKSLGKTVGEMALASFDMNNYVEKLDAIGQQLSASVNDLEKNSAFLLHANVINRDLILRISDSHLCDEAAIRQYLVTSKNFSPWTQEGAGEWMRRPIEGFNPLCYAEEWQKQFSVESLEDPLLSFVKNGMPTGRWTHPIIKPNDVLQSVTSLNVVLHGHFFYTELFDDFLIRLNLNQTKCDLVITTTDEVKETELRRKLDEHQNDAQIHIVPNRGRDVGAFITGVLPELIHRYDVIGHVHGKRSDRLGIEFGDRWRSFLWANLLGDTQPMIDFTVNAFQANNELGLVFPEDPHLIGWNANRKIADKLASLLNFPYPLPTHFDFPIGTMFWARAQALKPLLELKLSWDQYPSEPIAEDGTILHAIERLLPFVAKHVGYTYAATVVPGIQR